MSKRTVVCFDGTWNSSEVRNQWTNVLKFYRSVLGEDRKGLDGASPSQQPSVSTVKWYDPGVGTTAGERFTGGVFGYGLSLNVREGYKFVVDNYEEDDEIYIFGFSRGAYTARSLAGLIRNIGILRGEYAQESDVDANPLVMEGYEIYRERDAGPDVDRAAAFREQYSWPNSWNNVTIKFLGVWDTVGSLGIPGPFLDELDEKYAFHDTRLSRIVENAYQAVSIDEHRRTFEPTLWNSSPRDYQKMEQAWFVGAHSDVGGGSKIAFSDIALRWMQDKARLEGKGLEFDPAQIPDIGDGYLSQKPSDSYGSFLSGFYRFFMRLFGRGRYYRPVKQLANGNESIHSTASQKLSTDSKYKPKNPGLQ